MTTPTTAYEALKRSGTAPSKAREIVAAWQRGEPIAAHFIKQAMEAGI